MAVDPVKNQKLIENTFSTSVQRKTGSLGKDEFLNLLVTQLKYQDPLKPMEDKEFIAQMAQFSSLEQMKNMNDTFSAMKAFSLVGKHVKANVTDEKSGQVKAVEGDVTSVKMNKGKAYVVVNDTDVPVDDIADITEAAKQQAPEKLINLAGLIGRQATSTSADKDGKVAGIQGIIRSVSTSDNKNFAHLDGVVVDVVKIPDTSVEADPQAIKNYLDGKKEKMVTVTVKDPITGVRTDIQGFLRTEPAINGDKVISILDDVKVSVDSITDLAYVYIPADGGANNTNP